MNRWGRIAMYAGVIVTVGGLCKLHAVAHEYSWSGSTRFAWSIGYVGLLLLTAYSVGLPERPDSRRAALVASLVATATAALLISGVQLFVGDALLPRFVVLGSVVVLVPWFMLCAVLTHDVDARAGERDRVVVVATSDELATLEADLCRSAEKPAVLVGCLSPYEVTPFAGTPTRPLVDMVHARQATVVVLSRVAQGDDDVVLQATSLHEAGVRIRTLSMFYEQWLGKVPIAELERVSLLFDIGELHAAGYARVKHVLDVVLALAGVVALGLALPFVLIGNAIGNRGPLFYRQPRTGRNGTTFEILKFRTMRACRTDEKSDWTTEDDVRVTKFGGVLRRTHLDELPQVVNILRGDLSVVGPRPEQPQVVAELVGKIPYYGLRHLVRPGLTGWAQVKYQYAGTEAETLEKLQYEFFYLRHQSLGLDLRVVAADVSHHRAERGPMTTPPTVSIVMPTFNEEDHLVATLEAAAAQTYEGILEILVADGRSSDRTWSIARTFPLVQVVDNPERIQAAGLNRALEIARGDVIVRVDGHCVIADDYVERCVDALEQTNAAMVGGAMTPSSEVARSGAVPRGIASAMSSRMGAGPARFHVGGTAGWVDTVYLGAYRRRDALRVGGYARDMAVNEDAEFAIRMRSRGGIWFDPSIRSAYTPRSTFPSLARQFYRYGRGRATTALRHPRQVRPRQLVAPALVLGLLSRRCRPVAAVYTSLVLARAAYELTRDPQGAPALAVALPVMHLSWGLGFLRGLVTPQSAPGTRR